MNLIKKEDAVRLSEEGRVAVRKDIINKINDAIKKAASKGMKKCRVGIDYSNPIVKAVVDNEVAMLYTHKVVAQEHIDILKINWSSKK